MVRRMNGRQFKKLCKKAHALVIKLDPDCERRTYTANRSDYFPIWWHSKLIKGTIGFCWMTGYDAPECEDESAFEALWALVFGNICEISECSDGCNLEWPKRKKPRRANDLILLAKELVLAKEQ